jgi:hypothetical protein
LSLSSYGAAADALLYSLPSATTHPIRQAEKKDRFTNGNDLVAEVKETASAVAVTNRDGFGAAQKSKTASRMETIQQQML